MSVSPETVWASSDKELQSLLESGVLLPKTKKVKFYTPSFAYHKTSPNRLSHAKFPTISITGKECALDCKHCEGKVLDNMYPAKTPRQLFELAQKLKHDGSVGCLVSGGCLPNGSVPLKRFIPTLQRIKREVGLTIIVHTGIINADTAKALKDAEIDTALIDIIGSDSTIKQICKMDATIHDYEKSLRSLQEAELNFVPHIIVGLHNGRLAGELQALRMVSKHPPSALVIISLMPIRGTEMENILPPSPIDIARVVTTARVMFPELPLALGCMRPKGKHRAETDVLVLKAGVEAIAFPSEEAMEYAEANGFESSFSPYCCSQIYLETTLRSVSK